MKYTAIVALISCAVTSIALPAAAAPPPADASTLANDAFAKYEAGDYAQAVALYMQAYEKSVDARILFNVAQIYDKKVQDRDLAVEYYRRYLKSTTTEAELVATSTSRITELLRQQTQTEPPPPKPDQQPTPVAPVPETKPAVPVQPAVEADGPPFFIGWIVTGSLSAGALVTGILALDASGELSAESYSGEPSEEAKSLESRTQVLAGVTDALIAGALVSGAVTLIVQLTYSPESQTEKAVWISPVVSTDFAGGVLGGAF